MKTILESDFNKFDFKCTKEVRGRYYFKCLQDNDFDLWAFRGDCDELPWVDFVNDVNVWAGSCSIEQGYIFDESENIEGKPLLNIDSSLDLVYNDLDFTTL